MIHCEHCGQPITQACSLVRLHWDNMQGFKAAYVDEQCVEQYLDAMSKKYTLEHATVTSGVHRPTTSNKQPTIEDPFT